MAFKPYEPQRLRTPRSKPISPEEWDRYRDLIQDLYLRRRLTRRTVLQFLKEADFHPSPRQLTSQLADWNMFKNNSRQNAVTRQFVNVHTNAGTVNAGSDDQEIPLNTADNDSMTDDLSDDNACDDGANFDFPWLGDDRLNIDKDPVAGDSSLAVAIHGKELDMFVDETQRPFSCTANSSRTTTRRLETPTTRQSTTSSSSQLRLQPTSAGEVLIDLTVESPTNVPDMMFDEYDDDFASQLELALSEPLTQGGSREPWNELEHFNFPCP